MKRPRKVTDKPATPKSKQTIVTGRAITFDDGREVALYVLGPDTYGWRFVNKAGDVTQIAMSREAMNAIMQLWTNHAWQPFEVESQP
jgi:hypothetical protein